MQLNAERTLIELTQNAAVYKQPPSQSAHFNSTKSQKACYIRVCFVPRGMENKRAGNEEGERNLWGAMKRRWVPPSQGFMPS